MPSVRTGGAACATWVRVDGLTSDAAASSRKAIEASACGFAIMIGLPSLTARGMSRSLGMKMSGLRPMIATTSSSEMPTRLRARFRTSLTFSAGKPISSSVSRPSFVFLSESASSIPIIRRGRVVDRRDHLGSEAGRGVDDDEIDHLAEGRVDLAQEVDGDDRGVVGPARRDQHLDTRGVRHQEPVELLLVERAAGADEVEDRLLGGQPHAEADVPELQVEVDQRDRLAVLGERDREVGRGQRLAGAALGAEHADQRRTAEGRTPRRPPPCARSPSATRTAPRRG